MSMSVQLKASLSKGFKGKTFEAIGLLASPIEESLLDLDSVRDEYLFRLQGSKLLITSFEYKAQTLDENFLHYSHVVPHAVEQWFRKYGKMPEDIIIAAIYAGSVEPAESSVTIAKRSISMEVHNIYLKNLDGFKIISDTQEKIDSNVPLDADDQIRLIFSPLMAENGKWLDLLDKALDVARKIKDPDTQYFVLCCITEFCFTLLKRSILQA